MIGFVMILVENLFAEDRHDDAPVARSDITFQKKHLLPCSENRLAAFQGEGQGRTQQRGLQVGVAVAIVPGVVMMIAPFRRRQFVHQGRQVFEEPGFELDCPQRYGTSHCKEMDQSSLEAGSLTFFYDPGCEIDHLPVAGSRDFDVRPIHPHDGWFQRGF